MASKTTEWRPGPTVCRCCLTEGCYKDISTEYFWMGKREVYADMLSETFDLSIAYSQSGGPNSHSRLICEPCISRLRDAADFKRQVQECERTFTQYLDPGSSLADLEVTVDLEKEVKVERVKVEKEQSDDEEFDDRPDFGDDDDYDDLDDEPLTKLASKIPKKESVDVLDLIDNAKVSVKRKSSSKTKATPAKKAKTKKDTATSSKEKPEPRKKKGGNYADVEIKQEKGVSAEDNTKMSVTRIDRTNRGKEDRLTTFRNNIAIIMSSCTAYPFKYGKGSYLCFFCKNTFLEPEKLREHTQKEHSGLMFQLKKCEPLKMDFAITYCKLCGIHIDSYVSLKSHLLEHGKELDSSYGEPILPYKLINDEYFCQVCGKHYETFLSLHKHMPSHSEHIICETCGVGFATAQRMLNHARTHERTNYPCQHCDDTLESYASLVTHIDRVHRLNKRYKCPMCDETFTSLKVRKRHSSQVHG